MSRVGGFRSAAAQAQYERAYDACLATWPVAPNAVDVPTRYGPTHINVCGASSGVPVMLLHGVFSTSTSWGLNVVALGARHPVLAVDVIGDAGRSRQTEPIEGAAGMAAWLDDVVRELDADVVHLVGLSYGAWVTMNQAVRAPGRLASVTVIDPPGSITRPPLGFAARMATAAVTRSERAFERMIREMGNGSLPSDELFEVLRLGFTSFRTAQPFPRRISDRDLRSIRTPMQFLVGEHTPVTDPHRAVARLGRVAPAVRTAVIPDAAHVPPIEQAEVTNALILEFVDGVSGRRSG